MSGGLFTYDLRPRPGDVRRATNEALFPARTDASSTPGQVCGPRDRQNRLWASIPSNAHFLARRPSAVPREPDRLNPLVRMGDCCLGPLCANALLMFDCVHVKCSRFSDRE